MAMTAEQTRAFYPAWAERFAAEREALIALDGKVGDSDLGITMSKGFAAARDAVAALEEATIAGQMKAAGAALAKAAPSTMGTLMATGFLRGFKALESAGQFGTPEAATFWRAYAEGVAQRGPQFECQLRVGQQFGFPVGFGSKTHQREIGAGAQHPDHQPRNLLARMVIAGVGDHEAGRPVVVVFGIGDDDLHTHRRPGDLLWPDRRGEELVEVVDVFLHRGEHRTVVGDHLGKLCVEEGGRRQREHGR